MNPYLTRVCRFLLIAAVILNIVPHTAQSTISAVDRSAINTEVEHVPQFSVTKESPLPNTAHVPGTAPIIVSGHIQNRFDTPTPNLRIQLISDNGQIIDEARTASDGSFHFSPRLTTKGGTYSLQILTADGRPLPLENERRFINPTLHSLVWIEHKIRLKQTVGETRNAENEYSPFRIELDGQIFSAPFQNNHSLEGQSAQLSLSEPMENSAQLSTPEQRIQPKRTSPHSTSLQETGEISGTVTALNGSQPLSDVFVRIYNNDGVRIDSKLTNEQGRYHFDQLDSGSYTIEFTPLLSGAAGQFFPEYFDDKPDIDSATRILMNPGQRAVADAQLIRGGIIQGVITNQETPIGGVTVRLFDAQDESVDIDVSDETGAYSLQPLRPGNYRLLFTPANIGSSGAFLPEYYDNQADLDSATTISIVADETVTANADLARGGTIEGTVTGEGMPLDNIAVRLYDAQNNIIGGYLTDEDGQYRLGPLSPGTYRVKFEPTSLSTFSDFLPEFFDDQLDQDSATSIAILGSETVPANAELLRGGAIRGQVTAEETAAPLSQIAVTLYDSTGAFVKQVSTDASGFYTLTGLPTGGYHLRFDPLETGESAEFLSEYYEDKSSVEQANTIQVTAPAVTRNVNVQLKRSGKITGQVIATGEQHSSRQSSSRQSSSGQRSGVTPLAGIHVSAYDLSGRLTESTTTNAQGMYTITQLTDGLYWLNATPATAGPNSAYLPGHYLEPVAVTAPMDVSNIDIRLGLGGQIVGRVRSEVDSIPLGDVEIEVYDATDGYILHSATTDNEGYYTTTGLYQGSYQIKFDPSSGRSTTNYLAEFYGDSPNLASSTPVDVANLPLVSGINATLASGGQISGTVTAKDSTGVDSGEPLAAIAVRLHDSAGNEFDTVYTTSDGRYHFAGVPTGLYHIQFQPWENSAFRVGSPYLSTYYNAQTTLAQADPISVTAPAIIENINGALALGGRITGTVTAEDSERPLSTVGVRLYNARGLQIGTALTDEQSGVYEFLGLADGEYRLKFEPAMNSTIQSQTYVAVYSGGKMNLATADSVSITSASTQVFDAALKLGGQVTGQIVRGADGSGLANRLVEIYSASTGAAWGQVFTNETGDYQTPGLPTGSYWLAMPFSNNILGPIEVTAPNLVENIDASLPAEGTQSGIIAGRVIGADSSQPLAGIWVSIETCGKQFFDSTNHLGVYYFDKLAADAYTLLLEPSLGAPGTRYQAKQSTIQLAIDERRVDQMVMSQGGRIAGKITGQTSGELLENVSVRVIDADGLSVTSVRTNVLGEYRTVGIANGSYRLSINPSAISRYQMRYSGNQASLDAAQSILVSSPNTSNHNEGLPLGGQISGIVTAADSGLPLEEVDIEIYDSAGLLFAQTETDAQGLYLTRGLPDGEVRLFFETSHRDESAPYVSSFYAAQSDLASATTITVAGPTVIEDINMALQPGTQFSGFVTAENNSLPLNEVDIHVYDVAGNRVARGDTNRAGFYRTNGVRAGDYRIRFAPEYEACPEDSGDVAYAEAYYADKENLASANPIPVSGDETANGISAQLAVLDGTATPTPTSTSVGPDSTATPVMTPTPLSVPSNIYLPLAAQE
ncbi:MAG: carboxypeptidase regulatory-like domain-containing protein [Chloroflexota bacterium]